MKMEVELLLVGGYPCSFGRWFVAPPNRLKFTFMFNFSLQEQVEVVFYLFRWLIIGVICVMEKKLNNLKSTLTYVTKIKSMDCV